MSFAPFPISGDSALFGLFNTTVTITPQENNQAPWRVPGRADDVGSIISHVPALWLPDQPTEASNFDARVETQTGTLFIPSRLADGTLINIDGNEEITIEAERYRVLGDSNESDISTEIQRIDVERFE